MKSYSQCGQDIFVYNLMKGQPGKFLDLGCSLPKKINNTYLLELNGWFGISLDIQNFNEQWKERSCPFIQSNCLTEDYNTLLPKHYDSNLIDYLTLDMEGCGDRFKLLSKIMDTNYEFKIITIEHDSYMGDSFVKGEKIPQRELLKSKGYILIGSDISHSKSPDLFFEDWWVNPKHFSQEEINKWVSEKVSCDKIFEKLGINYEISDESRDR
jgi:hypothetical protein